MKFSVRACAYNHLIDPFKGISAVEVQSAYNPRPLDMPTSETLVNLLYVYWGRYIVLLEIYLPVYVILVGLSYYIRINLSFEHAYGAI